VLRTFPPFLVHKSDSQEIYRLLIDAFAALQIFTSKNEPEGELLMRTYLLDYLEQDSQGTATQKIAPGLLRECLQEWIEQYPEAQSIRAHQHILSDRGGGKSGRP